MRMNRGKILCRTVALLALSAVSSGCVKRMTAANEPLRAESSQFATLQSVTVSPDGSRVELVSDQPFTYTSYKSGEPPRIVIDISQAVPGPTAQPVEASRGNIRKVELTRQQVGGGVLTRAEIQLAKDVDFTAGTAPDDRKKLEVVLLPAEGEAKAPQAEAKETPLTDSKIVEKSLPLEDGVAAAPAGEPATRPTQPAARAAAEAAKPAPAPAGNKAAKAGSAGPGRKLNAVLQACDGLELSIAGGVQTFNSFKLTKPDRIVVDVFGVKNAIPEKVMPVGAFGVANLRIGSTADKVRVVLDASGETLPPYEVVKSDLGVKVRFKTAAPAEARTIVPPPAPTVAEAAPAPASPAAPAAAAAEAAAEQPAVPAAAPEKAVSSAAAAGAPVVPAAPAVPTAVAVPVPSPSEVKVEVPPKRHERGVLDAVDFKVVDGVSRITLKLYGSCEAGQPSYGPQGLSLSINRCQIPKVLQRDIDTSKFGSPVLAVTPYQVKAKGEYVAKLLIRTHGNPPFTVKRSGDLLVLDVVNPGPLSTPQLPPPPAVAEAAPAPAAEELQPQARPAESQMTEMPIPASEKLPGKKVYTGRRVTLEFSDADVRKIFQLIAEVSHLNFLISDDVGGTISIKLVNVPWDQALRVILDAKGLDMVQEGNIVQIKPKGKIQTLAEEERASKKAAESGMEMHTEVFEVNYASVGDIAGHFDKLRSERGTIDKDERTSKVVVKDIQPRIDDMRKLLKMLDTPEKQVMIEARIVEATSTFTRDLGIQWELHYKDGTASLAGINSVDTAFGGVVSTTGPTNTGSGGLGMGMSFGKLTSNIQLDMRLAASSTIGQVKIISTPKVVTLNNKAAKISQGQSIPYQTTSAEGTQTQFVEAALTLEVTPHITPDGAVSMKIKASNNSPGTGSPPPINKKEATTELVVANGETTVIGGIYVDNDTDTDTGIPFLSDIPLLGWLFKSNSKQKTKTELLIFITPKVVL